MTGEYGDSAIGPRIRAARERRGYSREELAYRSRLSWAAIEQIESGRRKHVRPDTLVRLCDALGLTADYVLKGGTGSSPMLEHRALLYRDEAEFESVCGAFLAEGLARSEAVLAVTTKANLDVLRRSLGKDAAKATFTESRAWYETPATTVTAYRRFLDEAAAAGTPWVRILGEPLWAGRSDDEVYLWTQCEALINLTFAAAPATIMCPYDERTLDASIVRSAAATHPQMMEDGDPTDNEHFAGEAFLLSRTAEGGTDDT